MRELDGGQGGADQEGDIRQSDRIHQPMVCVSICGSRYLMERSVVDSFPVRILESLRVKVLSTLDGAENALDRIEVRCSGGIQKKIQRLSSAIRSAQRREGFTEKKRIMKRDSRNSSRNRRHITRRVAGRVMAQRGLANYGMTEGEIVGFLPEDLENFEMMRGQIGGGLSEDLEN